MTVPYSWVLCYVRDKEELRDQERILRFFQKLARHNCSVASTLEIGTAAIWRRFVAQVPPKHQDEEEQAFASVLQPGVSEHVEREVHVYVTELQEQLTVEARLIARSVLLRGFAFSVTLAPADGTLLLSVDHERFFHRDQAGIMKFRYWVKLLQEVYAYWHPLFMHEFSHLGSANPSWDQVRANNIPALYTLNMFSPELVDKLGRAKLAQAPAWLMEDLADQGVLLIPTDVYSLMPEQVHDFEAVAQYLGFPSESMLEQDSSQ